MFTFVNIYDTFETIATAHKQINSFGFGDLTEIATSGTVEYSLMWVMPMGAVMRRGEVGNKYKILVMDKVLTGEVNELDVQSDTQQILLDVLAELKDNTRDVHLKDETITLEDFTERFSDDVTGWAADITLWVAYPTDRCSIPN